MIVMAPRNEQELRNIMFTASQDSFKELKQAITIRYPRGEGVMPTWRTEFERIEIGKGTQVLDGKKIAVLSIGHIGNQAEKACQEARKKGLEPALFDMRFVKPLDAQLLHKIFQNFESIITIEDAAIQGGFGSAIAEFMVDHHYTNKMIRLGIPDSIIEHGEQIELYRVCGIDAESILEKIEQISAPIQRANVN
jgi:1-deoxy-D-xylulose-5-phosphate synthase